MIVPSVLGCCRAVVALLRIDLLTVEVRFLPLSTDMQQKPLNIIELYSFKDAGVDGFISFR